MKGIFSKYKKIKIAGLSLLGAALIVFICFAAGVLHFHQYLAADCENPEICEICGAKRG